MQNEKELFLRWLQHPLMDDELRRELDSIQDHSQEIVERFYTHLSFGTGGLRGEIGAGTNRMNIYTVRKATSALAKYLHKKDKREKSVVIAYDCRNKSKEFAEEAALTLAKEGIRTYLYSSLRATPQLSFSVRKLHASAGIVITASHNPPEYNGYKVYGSDGAQLNIEAANQVIAEIHQIADELAIETMGKEEALEKGLLVYIDETLDKVYVDYVTSLIMQPDVIHQMADHFQIVFTPLHGTALKPVQNVLKKAGFKKVLMVKEQMEADPYFSTVTSPNPEEHEAFSLAIQYAQKSGADIIMGTDPDADRMGIVIQDAQGSYQVLTGNQTGALMLHYLLTQKKEKGELTKKHTICKTIVTSEMGREIGKSFGIETIDTLTGFKFIGEKIKEFHEQRDREFLFGYEESYGYLIGDEVRDKDAIQAVLLASEMGAYYKAKGMSLYNALQQLYKKYGYYQEDLISITLKGKEGITKINEIMEKFRRNPPHRVANQQITVIEDYQKQTRSHMLLKKVESITLPISNVLKYYVMDGTWFCIRPSGTEPKLKIYLGTKANSSKEAQEKLGNLKKDLTRLLHLDK